MTVPDSPSTVPSPRGNGAARPLAAVLQDAREREQAGCIPEAIEQYVAAITRAELEDDSRVLSEALRRLAVVRQKRTESDDARDLCVRSHAVAVAAGHSLLAAEALNTLGVIAVQTSSLDDARRHFLEALQQGGENRELRARAEQNLGVVANIQGDFDEALTRYANSLEACRATGNEHGCAISYHNLGMVNADQGQFDAADQHFRESYAIAKRTGDAHLQGLCLVNHAEVLVALQRYDEAQQNSEAALAIFDQLGAKAVKAEAYRMIGMVYRETGRVALAESRLRASIDIAVAAASVLSQAESSRELAILYQAMGRNMEALTLLNAAHRLFLRLDARRDLMNVGRKVADLETTYFAVVREWGQSIESSDSYTFGHCERVAQRAMSIARALGLDETQQTTIRLGAYLHDLGKVKVPHEILNKPGKLSNEEFDVIKMHPIWGIELLASVEFPWDLKPIIRWHHEKYDGSGYPDQLVGDEIPLAAQVVGIADVYDALTTTRAYRGALPESEVMAVMEKVRGSWSPPVYDAFMRVLADRPRGGTPAGGAPIVQGAV